MAKKIEDHFGGITKMVEIGSDKDEMPVKQARRVDDHFGDTTEMINSEKRELEISNGWKN